MSLFGQNKKPSSARVRSAELSLGVQFPHNYYEFLLATNGGRAFDATFPIIGFSNNPLGSLQEVYGVDARMDTYDLVYVNKTYFKGMPKEFIAIGCTPGVDQLLIDVSSSRGAVYYWDFRRFWGSSEWSKSDVYPAADSFDGFLKSLQVR